MSSDHPRVLGVLAGGDIEDDRLAAWVSSADVVLAADGGGDRLLALGCTPHTTIGDMDSTQSVLPLRRIIRDPDQESSDCDKLLTLAERTGHRHITLVGVEGDRLDHVLGTLASASRSSLEVRLVLRRGMAWVLKGPTQFEMSAPAGELVSLMPLEVCREMSITGVEWPLEDHLLAPRVHVSLSNRTTEAPLRVRLPNGSAVLILSSPRLEEPTWS